VRDGVEPRRPRSQSKIGALVAMTGIGGFRRFFPLFVAHRY
jgi:hypothetical protein